MKRKALLIFLVFCIAISTISALKLHKRPSSHSLSLSPLKKNLHKISLSKVNVSKEYKNKFMRLLAQSHKELKERKNAETTGTVFLQKSQSTCADTHEMKLGNYRNAQVTIFSQFMLISSILESCLLVIKQIHSRLSMIQVFPFFLRSKLKCS